VEEYVREDGSSPFKTWFDSLDPHAAAKVATAVARLSAGNTSSIKWFSGIGELRIDLGARLSRLSGEGRRAVDHPVLRWDQEATADGCRHSTRPLCAVQRAQESGDHKEEGEMNTMALTRDFKHTVVERVRRDPRFARSLLDEAATLFLNGDPEPARLLLRDLVNATVGFETLAKMTNKPAKSLHRMLSKHGNPSMDNLAVIFGAVRQRMKVGLKAQSVKAT
jgi:DNA-binding phage protein